MNEYLKNLNRIEFVITMACTGRCKHCSEGDHENCTDHIDMDAAVKAVQKICKHYHIESLMTFGGEALLYPETVCAIHKMAAECGIPTRQLITNGYFSRKADRIEAVAGMLAESGVNDLLLSVDAFHQETIPLEPVKYFAGCVSKTGIEIKLSPAWLVSREDNNPYNVRTREILKEFDGLNISEGNGNVIFPSGNALKYLRDYFGDNLELSTPYDEDPRDVRAISFSANGDVLLGNIYQADIMDIIETYRPDSR